MTQQTNSYIDIIFDDEFKKIISQIKKENCELIVMMNSDDVVLLIETQNKLRRIIKKYPFILHKKKQLGKPEYYAIIACLITDIDTYKCWENFKISKEKKEYYDCLIPDYVRDISGGCFCACGHDISYAFKIWTNTHRSMITGSECFDKEHLYDCGSLRKNKEKFIKKELIKKEDNKKNELLIVNRKQTINNFNIIHKFNQITKEKAFEIQKIKAFEIQQDQIKKIQDSQWEKNNNKYILIRMYLYNHTNRILIKFNWDFDKVIEYYRLTTY